MIPEWELSLLITAYSSSQFSGCSSASLLVLKKLEVVLRRFCHLVLAVACSATKSRLWDSSLSVNFLQRWLQMKSIIKKCWSSNSLGPSQIQVFVRSHPFTPVSLGKAASLRAQRPRLAASGAVGMEGGGSRDEKWSPTAERHARQVHFHRWWQSSFSAAPCLAQHSPGLFRSSQPASPTC